MKEFKDISAAQMGRDIATGRIDPVEVTEAFLDAASTHEFGSRIYARLTKERALAEAQAARLRAKDGQRRHALDGVPISWKDLFDSAGTQTNAGSDLLAGRVPARDARVLQTASQAGLICLGKTHMSELAFFGLGLNPVTETTPCVNDTGAVSGGSSSGAAGSVAFGLAAAAVGSDTGGSVRIPAAWNDLVGLKTTHGRLSLEGVVPLVSRFDTVGPLCRTVEDAGLMLGALEGATPPDLSGADLRGRRFGVLQSVALDDLQDAPAAAFDATCSKLSASGATLCPFHFEEVSCALADAGALYTSEAWATWGEVIAARPDAMYAPVRARFEAGRNVSASEYIRAWSRLETMRAKWQRATAQFDAVLMPSSPILPPKIDDLLADEAYCTSQNILALRNTRIGNLTGGASLTLPTDIPSCGLMLLGPPGSEHMLLRLGAAMGH